MPDLKKLDAVLKELEPYKATLVAVSKTKPVADIVTVLNYGHLHFGENYVQELVSKHPLVSDTVKWHFIGHLQSNKVKAIARFIHLIHGVDSLSVIKEINKQATINNRKIDVLLQVHIASEETKYGLSIDEIIPLIEKINDLTLNSVNIKGLMGMASFTDDSDLIRSEFRVLKKLFDQLKSGMDISRKEKFTELSMGMSSDYKIALEEGSTMVRIGSAIFGNR